MSSAQTARLQHFTSNFAIFILSMGKAYEPCGEIRFTSHILQQLLARNINEIDVEWVVENGQVIADYPDDKPYPSRLVLGFVYENQPLHVVLAQDSLTSCYLITAYWPDPIIWNESFTIKRSKL